MPNYQNGKIYKLVSPSGLTYIGSTCCNLAVRKAKHKHDFHSGGKNTTSWKLFEEDIDNVDIVLLEECPCDNKMQLHKKEREWIEKLECVNQMKPTRTKREWEQDNREIINKKAREKYHTDKVQFQKRSERYKLKDPERYKAMLKRVNDKRKNNKREWYEKNKDRILKERKEFYEENKDKIVKERKEFYEKNKDKILKQKKEWYEKRKI